MDEPLPSATTPGVNAASGGLAVASLALGIVSVMSGCLVLGLVPAVVGLVLGLVHLRRHAARRVLARWGVGLSLCGVLLGLRALGFSVRFVRRQAARSAFASVSEFPSDGWIGKPLPAFTLTALDGTVIHTAEWKGHRAVIDVWESWHPGCAAAVADFEHLARETAPQGVRVAAISFEDPADVKTFFGGRLPGYAVVVTNDLPAPFGEVSLVPTTFFVDEAGVIRDVRVGYDDYPDLKRAALGLPVAARKEEP